ncbi:MAG: carboxypeptidase-like regulatory domain-containing protein [Polyangiaceae bacterium]
MHAANARAEGPRIHVHGSARIEASGRRVSVAGGALPVALVLTGTLRDDANQPITNQAVSIQLSRGASSQAVRFVTDAPDGGHPSELPSAARCAGTDPAVQVDGEETIVATVAESGRFSVCLGLPIDRYVVHLSSPPSALIDAAKLELSVDLGRHSLGLRFDGEPRILSLDRDVIPLEAVAFIDEDGASAGGENLLLSLTDERGTSLGSARTNAAGHARFNVDPQKLAAPGTGELRLIFAGDADTSAASYTAQIERHTKVTLHADGTYNGGSSEDGIPIEIVTEIRGGSPPGGTVEARLEGELVGAAPVENGHAHVVATFVSPTSGFDRGSKGAVAPLTFRYLPDAPWYEPGEPLTLEIPLRGPSPWRHVPVLIGGIAVGLWLVLGRIRRSKKPVRSVARPAGPKSAPSPRVDIVREASDPAAGWTGRVVDAHDMTPIVQARVVLEHAGFGKSDAVASTLTDQEGRFVLARPASRGVEWLVVEAPLHATLRKPVPPAGEVEIAIVSRRRALLDRLVDWAKVRGKPYDLRPEPTPAHVRRVAGDDVNTARWASAVERAAFSGVEVDAQLESEIDQLKDGNQD